MEEKKRIDRIRESGGMTDIGTSEDGAIVEMINVGGRLLIIKEKSIYEMMLADDVDPQRTNINIPNSIHKLVINQGSESELVSKVFLTAKTLFKPEFFDGVIDVNKIMLLSLNILEEIFVLQNEVDIYLEEERKVSSEYESRKLEKLSYSIPVILNLETRCKTIFQKVDHIEQILMEINACFYPKKGINKQSHFPKFHDILVNEYGKSDYFSEFVARIVPFSKIVRALRNALDHRLDTVSIKNFELQSDGSVFSPTIELVHKEEKLERVSLASFLPAVVQNMIYISEMLFVYLAAKNARGIMAYEVRQIPEEKRRYKFLRYCFWSPLGEGGYYNQ